MNKSLNYVNLSLELHVISTFWLGSDTSGTFSLNFAQPSYELERPALKMHILWCTTDICSCKSTAKVSLKLDNSFPVPSLCKLKHVSVYFIQISTKITWKQLIPFRESHVFMEMVPSALGCSVNFNVTEISIKTARVSRLSFRFLWLCPNRHRTCIQLYYQRSNAPHHFHHVSNYFNFHLELLWCSCKLTCNRE